MSVEKLSAAGLAVFVAFTALPAHAYIGPGAGAGAIAIVFGVLAALIMLFAAILWYPLKRFFKNRRSATAAQTRRDTSNT